MNEFPQKPEIDISLVQIKAIIIKRQQMTKSVPKESNVLLNHVEAKWAFTNTF